MNPTWFTAARFGLFVHFGLYSGAARHEWVQTYERLTADQYQPYFEHFRPDRFDASAIARTARNTGMGYAVLTTKHHEGFNLWDTSLSNFTSPKACGRDLVAEFVEAVRAGHAEWSPPRQGAYTQNGRHLYLHLFAWPLGFVHCPSLGDEVLYARFLHDGSWLRTTVSDPSQQASHMTPVGEVAGTLTILLRLQPVGGPTTQPVRWRARPSSHRRCQQERQPVDQCGATGRWLHPRRATSSDASPGRVAAGQRRCRVRHPPLDP